MKSVFRILFLMGLVSLSAVAAEESFPLKAKRILFLGDSITNAGGYVNLIELQLRLHSVDPMPEVFNVGLSSEGCTGLSEPDHPFPRPDVHERLDRALAAIRPDVVVACYGMNDGIYYPFSGERFAKYQAGINRLIEKVHASGAKLILVTPPPFDGKLLKAAGKLLPAGAEKYAWFAVYEDYDDVIKKYGAWLMMQKDRVEMVIDVHTPVAAYVEEQRKKDPEFTVAPDGVHCNAEGHQILAATILKAWGVNSWTPVNDEMSKLITAKGSILRDAWLSHVGHKRPGGTAGLPLPEAQAEADEIDKELQVLINASR